MSSLLDIIASLLFGGTLFMIILTANDIAAENQTTYSGDMLVQEMLTSTAQLVEGELRNMGFGVAERERVVTYADSTRINFLCDLGRDGGTIDTIKYSLGNTNELLDTQNEIDRFLYRRVNSGNRMPVGTVTAFHLHYFTRSGESLPTPVAWDRLTEIYVVEVAMEVQNPYAPMRDPAMVQAGERNALYSSSLWQQTRLASQNSRR